MSEPLSWSDLVKDAGDVETYDPVPDGDYDLLVVDATYKPSKAGKKMWSTKNRIEGGPHDGRLVWDNLVVTPESPNALGYFFRKMATLGLTKDFFMAGPSDNQVAEQIKGRRFRGTLETRTYQGTKSNAVKTYHQGASAPAGGALPPSVSAPPPPPAPVAPRPPAPAPAPAPQVAATPAPTPAPIAAVPEPTAQPADPWATQTEQSYEPPTPPPTAAPEPEAAAAGVTPPPPPPF